MSATAEQLHPNTRPAMSTNTFDGPAMLSVSAAARLIGCARSTVLRRIEAGELTRTPAGKLHRPDVLRVFADLAEPVEGEHADLAADRCADTSGQVAGDSARTGGQGADMARQVAAATRGQGGGQVAGQGGVPATIVETMQSQLSDLIEQLAESREEMRRAEEAHAAERAAMISRLDRLLPAPEPTVAPEPPRGFWRRLIG